MDAFQKLASLKTLLIDDNEIIRDTLTMVFAYKKCFIKAVATAEEGLHTLEGERFDIIICDFSLPGINGAEFFSRIMASYPNTVKVLISGYAGENTITRALETGVDAFIRKPFSLLALLATRERVRRLKFSSGLYSVFILLSSFSISINRIILQFFEQFLSCGIQP